MRGGELPSRTGSSLPHAAHICSSSWVDQLFEFGPREEVTAALRRIRPLLVTTAARELRRGSAGWRLPLVGPRSCRELVDPAPCRPPCSRLGPASAITQAQVATLQTTLWSENQVQLGRDTSN